MATKSTLRILSGDRTLRRPVKLPYWLAYRLINAINNSYPYSRLDPRLVIRDFSCSNLDAYWTQFAASFSPSRVLCDLFWNELPWSDIKEELGDIRVLDSGCGAGDYGRRLLQFSGDAVTSYTGCDLFPSDNWARLENQYPKLSYHQCAEVEVSRYIRPDTNFFMTQSAIEHFNEDLTFFQRIKDHVEAYGKPVIQVHQFPSSACLKLYRLHGFRQYTPRIVSKITRLLGSGSEYVLYRLGGAQCNSLHYPLITVPLLIKGMADIREANPEAYLTKVRTAIEADFEGPNVSPAFYALVIHSNPKKKVF